MFGEMVLINSCTKNAHFNGGTIISILPSYRYKFVSYFSSNKAFKNINAINNICHKIIESKIFTESAPNLQKCVILSLFNAML